MSNKTSIQKMTAIAMVGVVVAAALVAAVAFTPIAASAQERGETRNQVRDQDHDRRVRVASGAGVATDTETGDDYRSGIRMIAQYDNSTGERTAVRGWIIISANEERVSYAMLPETWDIEVAEDGLTFEASGQVQSDGRVFDVTLDGYLGGPIAFVKRLGTMWSVDGTMSGEGVEYDLHYVAFTHRIGAAAADRMAEQ